MRKKRLQKVVALLMVVVMILNLTPSGLTISLADDNTITEEKTSDDLTNTDWENQMSTTDSYSSENVGRIWTDKSVSTDDVTLSYGNLKGTVIEMASDADFLVELSAMSSTSSQTTTTTSSAPVDVVFVIDLSGSMSNANSNMSNGYSRIYNLVQALNSAIDELMTANEYNRIAVVGYSSTSVTLLPLDTYSQYKSGNTTYEYFSLNTNTGSSSNATLTVNAVNSSGSRVYTTQSVSGGTNIQRGIYTGMNILASVANTDVTVTINGTVYNRTPAVVILSDGAATYSAADGATQTTGGGPNQSTTTIGGNWWNITTTNNNQGDGQNAYYGNGFKAMLTAAYMKQAISRNYYEDASVYTIGVGVTSLSTNEQALATLTLNPSNYSSGSTASTTTSNYSWKSSGNSIGYSMYTAWNSYVANTASSFTVSVGNNSTYPVKHPDSNDIIALDSEGKSVTATVNGVTINSGILYNDAYYDVTAADDMSLVFEEITSSIASASVASPTKVTTGSETTSGYVTFTDTLGEFMEVKDFEAIVVEDTIFATKDVSAKVDNGDGSYTTTYTFTGTVAGNVVYNGGELEDLKITVTSYDDPSKGDVVTVQIPATLLPLLYYDINVTKTTSTMDISEDYPMRVFYSVGLKDGVKSALTTGNYDSVTGLASYVTNNTDSTTGEVSFYSNYYDATKADDGKTIGDTTVWFEPAATNSFYYFQEDTALYTSSGDNAVLASSSDISAGTIYYYKHEYYYNTTVTTTDPTTGQAVTSTVAVADTKWIAVTMTAEEIASYVKDDGNGNAVISAGSPKLPLGEAALFRGSKSTSGNSTGTADYYLYPTWTEGGNAVTYLGNNGEITYSSTGSLEISKAVTAATGLNPSSTTEFTFTVTFTNASGSYSYYKVDSEGNTIANSAGTISSGETLTLLDGQSAVIYGLPHGAGYTVTETNLPTGYTAASSSESGTIAGGTTQTAAFTNTYKPNSVTYDGSLTASKTLTGRAWDADDSFTFYLTPVDTTVLPTSDSTFTTTDGTGATVTVTQDTLGSTSVTGVIYTVTKGTTSIADGQSVEFSLGTFKFDEPGTYTYRVTEHDGTEAGLTYSDAIYTIVFTVTDDGTGQLKVSAVMTQNYNDSYTQTNVEVTSGEAAFGNSYNAGEITFNVTANKTLNDTVALSGSYEFKFTALNGTDGVKLPSGVTATDDNTDADGNVSWTVTNVESGRILSGDIAIQASEHGNTYEYLVQEVIPTDAKLNNDGTYTYQGNTVTFDTSVYKYSYIVTYNNNVVGYTLTVYKQNANGGWDEVTGATTASFANTAKVTVGENGSASIQVKKTLSGRSWLDSDEFTFTLTPADSSTPMPSDGQGGQLSTATVTVSGADSAADYTKVFADITYTAAGTYTYTLTENIPADADKIAGISYDTHPVTVTVTVTDMGSYLSVGVSYSTGETVPEFTNTYKAEEVVLPTADAQFAVTKVLDGRAWVSTDQFTFKLTAGSNTAGVTTPMPERDSVTATISNQSPAFTGEVTYDTAGDYTYYIRETAGASDVGIDYDETVWKVVVHIEDDYTGQLKASMSYYKGTEDSVTTDTGWTEVTGTDPVTFTNTYTATPATLSRVGGSKTLVGRDMEADETFTFILTPTGDTITAVANGIVQLPGYVEGGSSNPTTATVTVSGMQDGDTQTFTFGEITFTKEGTYTFAITETSGSDANTTYDTHTTYATVTVYDDTTGALHAYVRYTDEDYSFTNVASNNTKTVTSDTDDDGVAEDVDGQMVEVGQELTYTINWVNNAYTNGVPAAATVTITDTIPTGTELVSGTLTGVESSGEPTDENPIVYSLTDDGNGNVTGITWKIRASAAESGSVSFTVKVSQDASSDTAIKNSAKVMIGTNEYDTNETSNYVPLTLDNLFQVQKEIVDASGNTISAGTYPWTVVDEYDSTDSDEEYWFRFALEAISAPDGVDLESILPGGTKTDVSPDNNQNPLIATNIYSGDAYNYGTDSNFGSVTYTAAGTYVYDLWERSPIMAAAAEGKGNTGEPIPGVSYSQQLYRVTVKVEFNATKGVLEVTEYTVTLVDDKTGEPVNTTAYTTTSYSDADNSYVMVITNTYNQDEELVSFRGIKSYTDTSGATTMAAGDFSFKFTTVTANAPVPVSTTEVPVTQNSDGSYSWTVTAAANGQFTSTDITYEPDDVGTYYYKVEEVRPDGAYDDDSEKDGFQYENMTYDTNTYYVKVVVTYVDADNDGTADTVAVSPSYVVGTEDGNGGVTESQTETAPTTSYGRIIFYNTYDPDDVDVDTDDITDGFGLKKTIEGRDWLDSDEFTFTLTADAGTPMPVGYETSADEKTLTYIATVKGTDTQDTDGAIAIDFGEITYSKIGTYVYTVKENPTSISGITIDSESRTITVTVKYDETKDALYVESIAVDYTSAGQGDSAKTFVNTYKSSGSSSDIDITKTLTGRTMNAGDFTFVITAAGADETATADASDKLANAGLTRTGSYTVTNVESNVASEILEILGGLTFTQEDIGKTFTYTVQEQLPTDGRGTELTVANGVTYDQSVYQVVITLSDDNAGGITAAPTITLLKKADGTDAAVNGEYPDVTSAGITFENTYAATGTLKGETYLKVAKTLTGRAGGTNEKFTFELTAGDYTDLSGNAGTVEVPMPASNAVSDGNGGYVYQTTVNAPATAGGTVSGAFSDITFTETGIYTYTITEVEERNAITDWSGAEYTVTVKVTDNGDGTLKVEVTSFVLTKNQKGQTTSGSSDPENVITDNTATFVNTYVEKEQEKEVTTDIGGVSTLVNGQYVSVGSTLTYTIDWYNTAVDENGTAAVATIKVEDTVPTGTGYVDNSLTWTIENVNGGVINNITPTTSTENGKITVTFEDVPANAYGTVSFTVTVTEDAYDAGSVENEASITIGDHDPVQTNTVDNRIPTKKVTNASGKDIDGELVGVGETLTYTIDWVNTAVDGDGNPADGKITITDTIPDGTDYVKDSLNHVISSGSISGSYNENTRTITWIIDARAGAYGSVSFKVTVNEDAVDNTNQAVTNQATIKIGENEYDTNVTTNYVPKKTGEVADSQSSALKVGDIITYTVAFKNTTATPNSISVEDALAIGLDYVADSANVKIGDDEAATEPTVSGEASTGETLTWTLENVEQGATVVVTFKVQVTEDADANVANSAIVDGHKSNTEITPVPSEDVKHVLNDRNQIIDGEVVEAGQTLTYEISWTNEAKADDGSVTYADTVTIVDYLPAGVTPVNYAGGTYNETDRTITWEISNLSTTSMERGTIIFEVTVDGTEGTIENEAIITANSVDKDTSVFNTVPVKDVATEDAADGDGDVVLVGDVLTYEVSYTNPATDENGNESAAANITITDAAPAGTTYVDSSAKYTVTAAAGIDTTGVVSNVDDTSDTIVWTFTNVPAGATVTATFKVTVTESALENIGNKVANTANVNVNNKAVVTREVVNYVVDKDVALASTPTVSVNGKTVGVGDKLTYTIDWANTATDEATGNPVAATVVVKDTIPTGTVLVPGSVVATGATSVHYIVNGNGGYVEKIESEEEAANVIAIEWTFENVAAGTSGVVYFDVKVSEDAVTTNEISNTASIKVGEDAPETTNETTNYVPEKTVEVSDSDGDDVARVGKELTYTVSFKNTEQATSDVVITDILEETIDYKEGSASGSTDETKTITVTNADGSTASVEVTFAEDPTGTLTWTVKDVPAGATGQVSFITVINEKAEGETVNNKATVTVGGHEATTNTVPVTVVESDKVTIEGTKTLVGRNMTDDDTFSFTLAAGNDATAKAIENGVVIIGIGTAASETVSADVTAATDSDKTSTVSFAFSEISFTKAGTYVFKVTEENTGLEKVTYDGTTYTVTVVVTEADGVITAGTPVISNGSETNLTAITFTNTYYNEDEAKSVSSENANGEAVKIDGELVGVGETLTYTIDWVNTAVDTNADSATYGSPVDATVTITDTIPAGTSYVEGSADTNYVIGSGAGTADVEVNYKDGTITWIIEADAAAYGSVSFSVTVNEDAVENADQKIENQAKVNVGDNDYDTNTTTNYVPKKTAELDSDSDTLKVGDVITYSITFRNTAETAENSIEVEDTLAAGLEYVTGSATVKVGSAEAEAKDPGILGQAASGQTLTWKLTDIEVGATVTITFKVEVTEDADASVSNQAIVGGHDSNQTITPVPSEDEKHALDSAGNIIDGEAVNAGDVLTYQITWTNEITEVQADGSVTKSYADTVTVTDTLPEGVTVVDYDDADATDVVYDKTAGANGTITWTFEGLSTEKMERGTITFTVTVDGTADTIKNTAIISANEYDKTASVTNTVPVKEVYEAEDTTISANGEVVYVGTVLTYEVSYTNLSEEEAGTADFTITDAAPVGTAYVEGSAKGTVTDANGNDITDSITVETSAADDGTITWSFKEVPEGATVTGTFEATVTEAALENAGNRVENQAEVTINGDDPVSTRKVVNYVVDKDVALADDPTVSVDGQTVGVGDTLTYTIDWANTAADASGIPAAAKVVVTDIIPDGTVLVPGSVPAAGAVSVHYLVNENGGYYETIETAEQAAEVIAIEWTFDAAAGASGTVSFKVTVSEDAATINEISNVAEIKVGDNDPVTTNEATNYVPRDPVKTIAEDSAGYADDETVVYDADTDTYTYADVAVGDTIEYVISYYNHNPKAADVVITDTLDPGVEYVEGSATDGGVYDAATHAVTWKLSAVAAQTEGTVSFKVTVTSDAKTIAEGETKATVENQAGVQVNNEPEIRTNVVENPIEPDPEKDPEKTIITEGISNGDNVSVGDELTYRISYYNNTNETVEVTITDQLDEGFDLIRATEGYTLSGRTLTWKLTAEPFTTVEVTLTVQVNANAKTIEEGETKATVENQAGVQVNNEPEIRTNVVENPIEPDPEKDPEKTIITEGISNGDNVSVGDELTYRISYYNNTNETVEVTITDQLDEGFDLIRATEGYTLSGRTLTWKLTAEPFTTVEVTLTVQVNANAKTIEEGETKATVENQAGVQVNNEPEIKTDIVENPVTPDDPDEPTKTVSADSEAGAVAEVSEPAEDGTVTGSEVAVDDIITYVIEYYNHLNSTATVTITDELDPGVTFEYAEGILADDETPLDTSIETVGYNYVTYRADTVTDEDGNATTTVTWTIYNVKPFTTDSVELKVKVTAEAKNVEDGETAATVENDAIVEIGEDPENVYTTNVVENPLEDDEVTEPTKAELTITVEDETADAEEISVDENGNITYQDVTVGDTIKYEISYYNHYATTQIVTITDVLDEGLTYVEGSASNGGVYDEATRTVTWELTEAPFTEGSVSFEAVVNETAKTIGEGETQATVENDATVEIGDGERNTTIVMNPIAAEDPQDPTKTVSESSPNGYDAEAETDETTDTLTGASVAVGDIVEYDITYYNNNNTTAVVTIKDTLDAGVDFLSATGTLKSEATEDDSVVYELSTDENGIVTVIWTITDVAPFSGDRVTLQVQVNANAKLVESDEDEATISNTASVQIG
ncbi:MAG: isopeptide-forming domain-containing fimbrial protein, partial [Lachnospiraceae bacterium]|nr:isopeptide-forming domain-containing fimbrial protein [Lachnospiraceae bacterium]